MNEVVVRYTNWQLLRDVATFIRPYRWRFWFASLCRLVGDLVWLYPPFALAAIIAFLAEYEPGMSAQPLITIVLLWAAAMVIRSVAQFTAKYIGYQIGEKIAIESSLKTLRHLFLLDMRWHEKENSGNKIKRIQNASAGLDRVVRIWFNNLIEIAVNFVGIFIILSQIDTLVLGLLFVLMVLYFVISYVLTRRASAAIYIVNAQEEVVSGLLFEAINNIRSVKVMAMAGALFKIVQASTEDLFGKIRTRVSRYQTRNSVLMFWGHGSRLIIFSVIIYGILNGRYELAFLVLFNGYYSNIWDSIDELSNAIQEFTTAKYSISRMQDVLDEPVEIGREEGKVALAPDWKRITFKDVSFSYGDNEVLQNLSFEVKRGEKVGIVGLSGAGKSTVFKLLLKEREEFTGDVLFDDVSLKDIRASDYFTQVSVVMQDTEVFNLSLKDNITITNPDQEVNQPLLEQAMVTAHVTDFLSKLPQGLDTLIGEKGVKLSGGERQRLGIARAIFKQPELLLMDEATSHLDLESEEKIRDSLHTFFEKVTAIVIAHRLTTIRAMDRILVLEGGKLIEQGSFDELYAKKGRFYELWEKQKL